LMNQSQINRVCMLRAATESIHKSGQYPVGPCVLVREFTAALLLCGMPAGCGPIGSFLRQTQALNLHRHISALLIQVPYVVITVCKHTIHELGSQNEA